MDHQSTIIVHSFNLLIMSYKVFSEQTVINDFFRHVNTQWSVPSEGQKWARKVFNIEGIFAGVYVGEFGSYIFVELNDSIIEMLFSLELFNSLMDSMKLNESVAQEIVQRVKLPWKTDVNGKLVLKVKFDHTSGVANALLDVSSPSGFIRPKKDKITFVSVQVTTNTFLNFPVAGDVGIYIRVPIGAAPIVVDERDDVIVHATPDAPMFAFTQ